MSQTNGTEAAKKLWEDTGSTSPLKWNQECVFLKILDVFFFKKMKSLRKDKPVSGKTYLNADSLALECAV